MKKDDFVDIMGEIENDLIKEVDEKRLENKKHRKRMVWFSAAACLAVALATVTFIAKPWKNQNDVTIPMLQTEVDREQSKMDEATELPAQSTATRASFPADVSARLQLLDFSASEETVMPSVAPYAVSEGLSNVINLDQFYLSDEKLNLLEENMFVVSTSYSSEFFETYEFNRYAQIPNYVTVDSMMHTYHLYFSLLLNRTEKNYLATDLLKLSKGMMETSMAQYDALVGTQWEQAAKRNVAYFAIAAELQEPGIDIPAYAAELVQWELAQIYLAEGIVESQLAEDFIDYIASGLRAFLRNYFGINCFYINMFIGFFVYIFNYENTLKNPHLRSGKSQAFAFFQSFTHIIK